MWRLFFSPIDGSVSVVASNLLRPPAPRQPFSRLDVALKGLSETERERESEAHQRPSLLDRSYPISFLQGTLATQVYMPICIYINIRDASMQGIDLLPLAVGWLSVSGYIPPFPRSSS